MQGLGQNSRGKMARMCREWWRAVHRGGAQGPGVGDDHQGDNARRGDIFAVAALRCGRDGGARSGAPDGAVVDVERRGPCLAWTRSNWVVDGDCDAGVDGEELGAFKGRQGLGGASGTAVVGVQRG